MTTAGHCSRRLLGSGLYILAAHLTALANQFVDLDLIRGGGLERTVWSWVVLCLLVVAGLELVAQMLTSLFTLSLTLDERVEFLINDGLG